LKLSTTSAARRFAAGASGCTGCAGLATAAAGFGHRHEATSGGVEDEAVGVGVHTNGLVGESGLNQRMSSSGIPKSSINMSTTALGDALMSPYTTTPRIGACK
jgi:hypothetical protein